MLSLPPGEGNATDGRSEDKPIILAGDTAEDFRSLLWALYVQCVSALSECTAYVHPGRLK